MFSAFIMSAVTVFIIVYAVRGGFAELSLYDFLFIFLSCAWMTVTLTRILNIVIDRITRR